MNTKEQNEEPLKRQGVYFVNTEEKLEDFLRCTSHHSVKVSLNGRLIRFRREENSQGPGSARNWVEEKQ